MSLKEKLISSHIVFQESLDPNSPIYDLRNQAIKEFEEVGFPTKKDEAWKYTSLNKVTKPDYSLFPTGEAGLDYKDIKPYFCLLYTSPSPRDQRGSRMPSSA